jgi:hypothetical protein
LRLYGPDAFFLFLHQDLKLVIDGPNIFLNTGVFEDIISWIILIAYFPVRSGSPGPLDKKTPSGFKARISLAIVVEGTTVTLHPSSEKIS